MFSYFDEKVYNNGYIDKFFSKYIFIADDFVTLLDRNYYKKRLSHSLVKIDYHACSCFTSVFLAHFKYL